MEGEEEGAANGGPASDEGAAADSKPSSAFSSFQACLELLKGPTDEKRLVGLLLAVKTMQMQSPDGSSPDSTREESIKAVAAAVGDKFIDRLLLPVSQGTSSVAAAAGAEEKETQCLLVGAAVAVLAVFCQVPDVATKDAMLDRLPALMKVVGVGGVRLLIMGALPSEPAGVLQDEAVVRDALDCAVQLAVYGTPTTLALLESGAMMAAAQVLERDSVVVHKLLAVRLVANLIAGPGVDRQLVLAETASVLPAVIQGLGSLLGDPRLLDTRAQANRIPQPAAGVTEGVQIDAAALQLEALHTLLLLLPLPEGSEAAEQLRQEQTVGANEPKWVSSIRRGLNWVLRSKTGGEQRLATMQLAAAMVELRGAQWILPPAGLDANETVDSFVQVLAETLWVELTLLLHDALHPQRVTTFIPLTPHNMERVQEQLAGCELDDEGVSIEEVEEAGPTSTDGGEGLEERASEGAVAETQQAAMDWVSLEPPRPKKVGAEELERASASEKKILEQQAEMENAQKAGERASQFLPACYRLVEAVVEVLCEQEEEGEMREHGIVREEVAERVMKTLGRMVDDLLQFMETSAESPEAHEDPLVLGATRVLGAYYAQAPEAAGKLVQELLPFMMKVKSSVDPLQLSGPHFLLPMLLMCTTQVQPTESQLDWRRFLLEHHTDVLSPLAAHAIHLTQHVTRFSASASSGAGSTGNSGSGKRTFDAFRAAGAGVEALNGQKSGLTVVKPSSEVLSLESSLWDVSEVLLAVVDRGATQQPQQAQQRTQGGPAESGLGPVTQVMLPLVWELGSWAEARVPGLSADCAAPDVVTWLCKAEMEPHVWLCAAAVAAVVQEAVVRSGMSRAGALEDQAAGPGLMGPMVFSNVPELQVHSAWRLVLLAVLAGAAAVRYVADQEQGKAVPDAESAWSEKLLEEQRECWDRTTGAATSILEGCPAFVQMCAPHLALLKSLLDESQMLDVDLVNLQLFVRTLTAIHG